MHICDGNNVSTRISVMEILLCLDNSRRSRSAEADLTQLIGPDPFPLLYRVFIMSQFSGFFDNVKYRSRLPS